jgi:bacteriocin-like protein
MKELSTEKLKSVVGGWSWTYCAGGAAAAGASGAASTGAAIGSILGGPAGATLGYFGTLAAGCLAANGVFH